MTDQSAMEVHVGSSDSHASILAALARIEAIPAGPTLIDLISEDDWHDDVVSSWRIEVKSATAPQADEFDELDTVMPQVA